jgi:hypothetical protein
MVEPDVPPLDDQQQRPRARGWLLLRPRFASAGASTAARLPGAPLRCTLAELCAGVMRDLGVHDLADHHRHQLLAGHDAIDLSRSDR